MSELDRLLEEYRASKPKDDVPDTNAIKKIKGASSTERLLETDASEVKSPVEQVDPDTVKYQGQSYRLEGFNAPETSKRQGGIFIPPQVTGDTTGEVVNKIANIGGFNILAPTGKRDPYGRIIAKQVNEGGTNLGDVVTQLGITPTNQYTSNENAAQATFVSALMEAMPTLAQADPVMRLAMEERARRSKDLEGRPSYVPKMVMQNEANFAAAKGMVGTKAAQEQVKEIDRLQGILSDPAIKPETRVKLEKQLNDARDKLWIAATTPDFAGATEFRKSDRNIMNQAYDQFSTSFSQGVKDLQKGLYGFTQMAGESAGWDWLVEKSINEVARIKAVQGEMPDTLSSYKDIKGGDTWETISNTGTYVTNLLAGTLPSLAVMAGSAMATGGLSVVPALVASTAPMSVLYSGQYYADQPEGKKNASLALAAGIASAALDRLGLEAMVGGVAKNLFTQVGRKEAIDQLVKLGKAASPEAAEEMLKGATRSAILEATEFGAKFASQHYASKAAMMAAVKSMTAAAGGEALTEAGQQALQMIAQTGEIDPDIRYEKYFYEGLIDAAIGGGVMGGAFNAGGVAMDAARWHSAASAKEHFEGQLTDYMQYQAEQRAKVASGDTTAFTSTLDAIGKTMSRATDTAYAKLDELPVKKGVWNGFMSVVKDPVRVLRSLADTAIRDIRKPDGSFAVFKPVILSIMKAGVLAGDHFDGFRQRIIGEWNTESAESLATRLGTSVYNTNSLIKEAWDNVWSRGGTLNRNDPQQNILQEWKDSTDAVANNAFAMMAGLGADTSKYATDLSSIFEEAAVDINQLSRNRRRVIETMVSSGSSEFEANKAMDNLVSGNPELAAPAKRWLQQHGVFSDSRLSHMFEPNIFNALENFKHRVASDISKDLYLGKDGDVLAKLLHLAKQNDEFASEEEFIDASTNVRDFYRIATGTYNSLENYPFIEKVLGWGVTMTMLASLSKAALSSIPEAGISTLGTPGEAINKQLKNVTSTLIREIRNDLNAGISYASSVVGYHYARDHPDGRVREAADKLYEEGASLRNNPNATLEEHQAYAKKAKAFYKKHLGRSLFERLGYSDSGYNTQTKFETNTANMKRTMQVYSRLIGLRAVTDTTRIAAMSVATDIMRTRLEILRAIPAYDRERRFNTGEDLSNEQFQALKELQKFGMNVLETLHDLDTVARTAVLDPNETPSDYAVLGTAWNLDRNQSSNDYRERLHNNLMTGLRNMVDSKVVNPQIGNLPKYYHDPRLRVFTAMTRFIAGLTATILPKLYKDYIKDGNAGMRYQSFAVMAQAMVFAHFSSFLKDLLSYGDDESPYIKSNVKKAQRALYGSGLLGRVESIVDTVAPLYDFKQPSLSKEPVRALWSGLKSSAAPISWADRVVQAAYNIPAGDTALGVKQAIRAAPFAGSFPIVANTISNQIKGKE